MRTKKVTLVAKTNPEKCEPDFKNIDSICEAFGIDPKSIRRGYLRAPSALHPHNGKMWLWWPSGANRLWENRLSSDGLTFSSRGKNEPFNLSAVLRDAESGSLAVVFFRPASGRYGYRFIGVFCTDAARSRKELRHIYARISNRIELS